MPDLNRATTGKPAPPVRIVHLGLGAFHRAHQAWYTHTANQAAAAAPWGIAAFTGRRPRAGELLRAQGGLYTLITRSATGDSAEIIDSIAEAHDGSHTRRWNDLLAHPDTALVTLTITEAGYRYKQEIGLNYADATVAADITVLRHGHADAPVASAPGRLVQGLRARRAAGSGDIAILSCDNLSRNGEVTRTVVLQMASAVDRELAAWIDGHVSFVSSMVDRITPAGAAGDEQTAVRLTGYTDHAPVVTEPFTEWIIAGDFPAGRPEWERAGARFVDDIEPYEQRKLWLLNAGHSLLAYTGLLRGHTTIAQAVEDDICRDLLEKLWEEAAEVLPFSPGEIAAATAALRERFANPAIRHLLLQVARDGSQKIPLRCIPVIERRLDSGRDAGTGQTALLAAWLLHLKSSPAHINDPSAANLIASLGPDVHTDALRMLREVAPGIKEPSVLAAAIVEQATRLAGADSQYAPLLKGTL
ncbi:mannitol dehydrogenase family protein [Pseudarthrobacter sp. NPDC080039]|uniref:mannitol dehydrogenase family protein n=1 Tax=unclassified Pseudarthrobacter TaxID=2647000 RepID=UPI00344FFC1D